MSLRRDFTLPDVDIQFLEEYGRPWEAVKDGSLWVLVNNFPIPRGYAQDEVTAAIRIETGYPEDAALDMVYFYPPLSRTDGQKIGASDSMQPIDGKQYQRWSRHYTAEHPFVRGQDNLGTHILTIEDWLAREFRK